MKKLFYTIFGLLALVILGTCGGGGSSLFTTSLNSEAQQTIPVLNSAVASSSSVINNVGEFTLGNINYEIYMVLGDPANDTTTNRWGMNNLYNVLAQCDSDIKMASTSCQDKINKVVASPFPFGNADTTYECAANKEFAWKIDSTNNIVYGLMSYDGANSDHQERNTTQVQYNQTTGDLLLDQVGYNSYTPQDSPNYKGSNSGKFIMRTEIRGNTNSHTFTLRMIKRNLGTTESGYEFDLVGSGKAKGDGNYFLLRAKDNSNLQNTSAYYCFPATATIDQIKVLPGTSYDTVDSHCDSYKDTVKNMKYFNDGIETADAETDSGAGEIPLAVYDPDLKY